jgi:hypothetical protein
MHAESGFPKMQLDSDRVLGVNAWLLQQPPIHRISWYYDGVYEGECVYMCCITHTLSS